MNKNMFANLGYGALFAFGIALYIQVDAITEPIKKYFEFSEETAVLTGTIILIIAIILIIVEVVFFLKRLLELTWRNNMGPLILIVASAFLLTAAIIWSIIQNKASPATKEDTPILHNQQTEKNENEQKPQVNQTIFEIVPPDPAKTEITSYEINEDQKDDLTSKEIYHEIYTIGIKNTSKDHKTLEGVGLKSRTTRQQVQKRTHEGITRTFMPLSNEYQQMVSVETDATKVDIDPGETRYFKFAFSYSLGKPAFSRKDMYDGKIIKKDEYIQLFYKTKNGDYFNFYNIIKVGEAILEMPFQLKYSRESLPMGVFCVTAKNTPPKYFKLEVHGDESGSIKFHIDPLSTFDETLDSIEIMR